MAPSTAALSRIQPLTTVLELERAVTNAQQAGRILVVKVHAPWCAACKVIEPRYRRAASSNLEVDFCEVNFVQAKLLCKHSGVENLPTGMIFKDGKKVEHSSLRPSGFKSFVKKLMAFAEPESPGSAALESYQSTMDEMRVTEQLVARVAGLSEEPSYEARWHQSNIDELRTMDALSDVTR